MSVSKRKRTARAWILLAPLWLCGCLHPTEPKISPDAPVLLAPGARRLRGRASEDVYVVAQQTLLDEPMDTTLVRRVATRVRPAVVSIYAETSTPYDVTLLPVRLPGPRPTVRLPGSSLGSGFFVHGSGLVLTNNHVVHDAKNIYARTVDGYDYELILLAVDPVYDLALLQTVVRGQRFPPLPMGDSELVDVGDFVIAVGNPLGLGHTVTSGIISQTDQHLEDVDPEDGREVDYIQTDTAINPGSSGGPLITLAGAWVGVNTAGIVTAQNIGFAVPSRQVRDFLEDVLAGNGVPAE